MYAFISRYWDGRGAVWNRVTVLVHLKVVYAAVEMLLPQTRHCLRAYLSAQQRALTKTQRSCPSSWNSCMKSLTTCMGSQVSASWLAQDRKRERHKLTCSKSSLSSRPLSSQMPRVSNPWPWLSPESDGCTWLPGLFYNSRSSLTRITRNQKFWPSVLSLQSTVHAGHPIPKKDHNRVGTAFAVRWFCIRMVFSLNLAQNFRIYRIPALDHFWMTITMT